MDVFEVIFNAVVLVVFIIAMCLVSNDKEHWYNIGTMKIEITIPDREVKDVCEQLNLDYTDPAVVEWVEQNIIDGIQDHIRLRDWSLSELVSDALTELQFTQIGNDKWQH